MRRKIVVLYFLISSLSLAIDKGRSEIERFHILNDRKISDKFLLDSSNQYFYIDTESSSKLIKLFGDVSNTESSSSEADQVTDITEILTSELNTEKYLNLHIDAQLPLIPFSFKDFKFLPGVFAEFHLGTSLSIDNEQNALVPEVNLYAMNQVRYGIQSLIKHPSIRDAQFKIRVYKNSIKDLEVSKNSTEIAQNDAIVDLDELEKQAMSHFKE